MPIAADPGIWAFAVEQMELADTHSSVEVWSAEIGKHKSQCTRDRSTGALFVGVWPCTCNLL